MNGDIDQRLDRLPDTEKPVGSIPTITTTENVCLSACIGYYEETQEILGKQFTVQIIKQL